MAVVATSPVDTQPRVTGHFTLDHIETACDLFANQRDGVLKVAVTPRDLGAPRIRLNIEL